MIRQYLDELVHLVWQRHYQNWICAIDCIQFSIGYIPLQSQHLLLAVQKG